MSNYDRIIEVLEKNFLGASIDNIDNNEKKEIIESLFSGKTKDIFIHYFL